MTTPEAAEHMLTSGTYYTAAQLAHEANITAKQASGLLFNVRNTDKYSTEVTELPNRTVKVIAINGRKMSQAKLWAIAIGIKKVAA